jgi:hypothetical protein
MGMTWQDIVNDHKRREMEDKLRRAAAQAPSITGQHVPGSLLQAIPGGWAVSWDGAVYDTTKYLAKDEYDYPPGDTKHD